MCYFGPFVNRPFIRGNQNNSYSQVLFQGYKVKFLSKEIFCLLTRTSLRTDFLSEYRDLFKFVSVPEYPSKHHLLPIIHILYLTLLYIDSFPVWNKIYGLLGTFYIYTLLFLNLKVIQFFFSNFILKLFGIAFILFLTYYNKNSDFCVLHKPGLLR